MKPIIFITEEVQTILDGRKSQYRIPIKSEVLDTDFLELKQKNIDTFLKVTYKNGIYKEIKSKYKVDDILYVKEKFQLGNDIRDIQNIPLLDDIEVLYYEKEINNHNQNNIDFAEIIKWKPSVHMKKEQSRIFLKITNVRVERLQDILVQDIIREGYYSPDCTNHSKPHYFADMAKKWWINLWNSKAKDGYKWEDNPYVFVYEFEKVEK